MKQNGHKWTSRCGSTLFGEISPDPSSMASGRASSFIRPKFYWRRRREKGEKSGRVVRGRFGEGGVVSFYELCQRKSRNKIFETRARILALAYIRRSFPFRYGPPFALPLLSFFLIFTSRPFFFFIPMFDNTSRLWIHRYGKKFSRLPPTEDALHLAANSLSKIKLIFARPISYIIQTRSFRQNEAEYRISGLFPLQPRLISYPCKSMPSIFPSFIFSKCFQWKHKIFFYICVLYCRSIILLIKK